MKIGILGHFAIGKDFYDGQTVKTREMFDELKLDQQFQIDVVDTYTMKDNKKSVFFKIWNLLKNNNKIIISLSWNGHSKVMPIIYLYNLIFRRPIFDVVIGGNKQEHYKKSLLQRFLASSLSGSYVESQRMVKAYNEMGLTRVKYMPNFKKLDIVKKDIDFSLDDTLPVCTFSRVCAEKGIEEAIQAVIKTNQILGKKRYTLTIYGNIEDNYKKRFADLMKQVPSYISYGGLVPYDQTTEVLKNYFLLLFPTWWEGEGFPGTLIDAFAAGVPAIVSDWKYNSEIIQEGKTGYIIPIHDVEALSQKLIYCSTHINTIEVMQKSCQLKMSEYLPINALSILKEDLIK